MRFYAVQLLRIRSNVQVIARIVVSQADTGGIDCVLVLLFDTFTLDKTLVFLELLFYSKLLGLLGLAKGVELILLLLSLLGIVSIVQLLVQLSSW